MGCTGLLKSSLDPNNLPLDPNNLPTDPKYVKVGELIVSLMKSAKQLSDLISCKEIKFKDVWELINTVV